MCCTFLRFYVITWKLLSFYLLPWIKRMSFDCQLSSSLRQSSITDQYLHMRYIYVHTVDGRNPAPVDKYFVQLFLGLYTSQVVNRISLFHGSYIFQPKHGKCCEGFEDRRFQAWNMSFLCVEHCGGRGRWACRGWSVGSCAAFRNARMNISLFYVVFYCFWLSKEV